MKKRVAQIGFVLLFGLPAFIGLTHLLGLAPFRPLAGSENSHVQPSLTWESWSSTKFQTEAELAIVGNLSSRPAFIRTYNELFYRGLGQTESYVLIGKQNQFFAYNYFPSFRGFDFKGKTYWERQVEGYIKLRDSLAYYGIPLLVVIAPNKVRYMPEHLPDHLVKTPGETTNQRTLSELCEEKEIPLLNLNTWFTKMKDTVSYPLFPNSGSHWSGYGAILGMDTIVKFLESQLDTQLVQMVIGESVHIPDSFLTSDRDMTQGVNLWTELPTEKLYYPKIEYRFENALQPNVLVIGDSYFWGIENLGLYQLFSPDYSFWYYNNTNYDSKHGEVSVDALDRWNEILQRDAVLILGTESNLVDMPYGLLEDLGLME